MVPKILTQLQLFFKNNLLALRENCAKLRKIVPFEGCG
jgi:hypothetical protein